MHNHSITYLPTAYLGSAEYYATMMASEKVIIEKKETYCKQTIRNRSCILTANGPLELTIPITKPNGSHSLTEEIGIFNKEKWQQIHWRAIVSAYNASPFFMYYQDDLENFYKDTFENLLEFNTKLLQIILDIIGISKDIDTNNSFINPKNINKEEVNDLRYRIGKPTFSEYYYPKYTQVFSERHGFKANLSIIDLLFNLGPETLSYLKKVASSNQDI